MTATCVLCGSSDLAVTGYFYNNTDELVAVYHLCGGCWALGPDTVGLLVEELLLTDAPAVTMH